MSKRVLTFIGAASLAATLTAAAATRSAGTFALQGEVAATSAYLAAMPGATRTSAWNLDFWLTKKGSQAPVTSYELDMSKLVHVIVISDDFATFMHEHPASTSDGHFKLAQTFPEAGKYHVYFDGRPTGFGQQVFRFELNTGSAPARPRDLSRRSPTAEVDGYTVALSGLSLRAGSESALTVRITKGGKPANDLHPYLDALAHVVLIDAGDLSYVHVHPETMQNTMSSMNASGEMTMYPNEAATIPPNMLIHVAVKEPGTYKMWFQFRGGSSLHVASFVLTAA